MEGYREHSERVSRALLGIELEDEEPLEGEAFQRAATELVVGSTIAQGGRRFRLRGPALVRPGLARSRARDDRTRRGPSLRGDRDVPARRDRGVVGLQVVARARARGPDGGARARAAHERRERAPDRRAPAVGRAARRAPRTDPRAHRGQPPVRAGGRAFARRRRRARALGRRPAPRRTTSRSTRSRTPCRA